MQGQTVTVNEKEYRFNFPSTRRAKMLSEVLACNIFLHGLKETKWDEIGASEDKTRAVLSVIMDDFREEMLDEFTLGDIMYLTSAFFLRAKRTNAVPESGLKSLVDIINVQTQTDRLPDGSSTLPSTESATEIPPA